VIDDFWKIIGGRDWSRDAKWVDRWITERLLRVRLSDLFPDGSAIDAAMERAFDPIEGALREPGENEIDWHIKITATAMSFLAEIKGPSPWLDDVGRLISIAESDHERRSLVFAVMLSLDGCCQWELTLRAAAQTRSDEPGCLPGCEDRLRKLIAATFYKR
jgi:hypothetical protein